MILVSIPVHEQKDVIADQARNFAKFLPDAHLVFHLSRGATFSTQELSLCLSGLQIRNWSVNPVQVPTGWGSSIVPAHLSNISYIRREFPNARKIAFHSSNDMLVKQGAGEYIARTNAAFNARIVAPDTHWWPGNGAWHDEALRRTVQSYGASQMRGGQIEGSFYPADFLYEAQEIIERRGLLRSGHPIYTREEVYFPALAHAVGLEAGGLPYVFSEVHRFDRRVWMEYARIRRWSDGLGRFRYPIRGAVTKIVNDAMFRLNGWYAISRKDIDAIREKPSRLEPGEWLNDGDTWWKIYDTSTLFGVKRIERKMGDPVRRYIGELNP